MLENKNFAAVSAKSAATVDEGLRQYMIKVYNYMAAGLCLTAFAAYLVANTSLIRLFFNITPQGASLSGLGWLFLLAPFLMIFAFGWVINRGTLQQVQGVFWGFSAVMGISLAPIFLTYTGDSITRLYGHGLVGRHYRFHRQYLYAELRPEFCAVDSDCHHLYRPYRVRYAENPQPLPQCRHGRYAFPQSHCRSIGTLS